MKTIYNILMIGFFLVSIIWTFKLRFPQFRVSREVRKLAKKNKSAYRTYLLSLGTHIGTGNLIGVATGLIIGGPGVIFWMWVFAFFSSSLALVENTYAIKFREKIDGEYRGGASFYIRNGLKKKGIALFFAFSLLLTNTILFPPLQVNTIVISGKMLLGINPLWAGVFLFGIIALLSFKGTKRIVDSAERIVPPMAITYTVLMLLLIVKEGNLIETLSTIIDEALVVQSFNVSALLTVMGIGIRRSFFSNEAGLGTTPSISAMAEVDEYQDQGYYQMLGVFVDTLLMCTITGFFIIQRVSDFSIFSGGELLFYLFEIEFGFWGIILSFLFLFTFAFVSLIGGYYLGESNALFFSINGNISPKTIVMCYRILFSLGIIFGIFYSTERAMMLVDFGLILLGMTNIWAIFTLEKVHKVL
ncbi:MAG: alanine:cation symporter family protein [Bacilli bacterium]|jgi:AGCS family alanine or glycine:cation symporter|nr:alanine:cation symporter family protein [Bacilli bacterium]HHU24478.1 alanine:cation symporter family protein [Acholeplasmataceae bacterium]